MRSTGVHHVDLVVSSIERSLPFYRDLLGPLGFHRISEVEGERGETIWYFAARAARSGSGRRRASAGYDRYRVGLHHLAFEARSRGSRRRAAGWLVEHGRRDRERAAGVRLLPRLLRRLLLRPRRDQARDRPRARLRRLSDGRPHSYATGAYGPSTFELGRSPWTQLGPARRAARTPPTVWPFSRDRRPTQPLAAPASVATLTIFTLHIAASDLRDRQGAAAEQ